MRILVRRRSATGQPIRRVPPTEYGRSKTVFEQYEDRASTSHITHTGWPRSTHGGRIYAKPTQVLIGFFPHEPVVIQKLPGPPSFLQTWPSRAGFSRQPSISLLGGGAKATFPGWMSGGIYRVSPSS